MHSLVVVRFDRVFDVQRYGAGRYNPAQTQFSFESEGRNHYAVQVMGFPAIEPGMTVTAMLRKKDNWQTLAGWKTHSSGNLVLPPVSGTKSKLIQAALVTLISTFGNIAAETPTGKVAALLATGTFLTITLWNFSTWRRYAAEAQEIRGIDLSPNGSINSPPPSSG